MKWINVLGSAVTAFTATQWLVLGPMGMTQWEYASGVALLVALSVANAIVALMPREKKLIDI